MKIFESLRPKETEGVLEASLPMNTSHDKLRDHISKALRTAHGVTDTSPYSAYPSLWEGGVFPNHVVYSHSGQLYKRSYTAEQGAAGTDPVIKLGAHKPVHAAYVDSKESVVESVLVGPKESVTVTPKDGDLVRESADFLGDVSTLKESATMPRVPIKIIGPGWGSMAYYSKEMLMRDGPKVYTKGTPMFWNHATDVEESQRPEGDLDNLAAVLTKDAAWQEHGVKGPGLYSEAKVFSDYATQVTEKGAHIGVSINAAIKGKEGEAEGRRGRIAEQLLRAFSVDFVTRAGAGGAPIVPVQESDRGAHQETAMTEAETKAQADLVKENADLKARLGEIEKSQNQVLAIASVAAVLKEADIPFRQSLLERACVNPVMKEHKVDPDWVKAVVKDFSDGEQGSIRDFGEGHLHRESSKETTDEQQTKRMKEALKDLGVPAAGLDFAVAGRGGRASSV